MPCLEDCVISILATIPNKKKGAKTIINSPILSQSLLLPWLNLMDVIDVYGVKCESLLGRICFVWQRKVQNINRMLVIQSPQAANT